MSFAGNSATNPVDTNDPVAGLIYGFDKRVAAIIASVLVFALVALCCICVRNHNRVRRMREFFLNNPHTLTLLRELREGPPKPTMKTVALEMDLEIGESFVDWANVMPLSAEKDLTRNEEPKHKSNSKDVKEDEYVRITLLVALPSPSGRRNPSVVLDACYADADGTPLHVPHFRQELGGFPETAFGILERRVGA